MSMHKYTYVMTGIRRTWDELKESNIDIFSAELEPLLEGNDDNLSIVRGEGSDFVYIGHVVAKSGPNEDEQSKELAFPSHQAVAHHLDRYNFNVCGCDVNNWFFDVYR